MIIIGIPFLFLSVFCFFILKILTYRYHYEYKTNGVVTLITEHVRDTPVYIKYIHENKEYISESQMVDRFNYPVGTIVPIVYDTPIRHGSLNGMPIYKQVIIDTELERKNDAKRLLISKFILIPMFIGLSGITLYCFGSAIIKF